MTDPTTPATSRLAEVRTSWRALTGSMLGLAVGLGSVPLYTNSVLFVALEEEYGWQESSLTLVFLITNLLLAVVSPFAGRLVDRFGSRPTALVSAGMLALSYVVLSFSPGSFPLYVTTQVMVYIAAACTTGTAYARVVAGSFDRLRGLALGVMNTGPALAAMILPGVAASLLDSGGVRLLYLGLAAVIAVGAVVFFVLVPRRSDPAGVSSRAGKPASIRPTRTLVTMVVAFFTMAFATIGTIELLFGLLLEVGTTETAAIAAMSSMGLAMLLIRLGIGALLDVLPVRWVAASALLLCVLGLVGLAVFGAPMALVSVLAIGLALGSETDVMAVYVSRYFPRAQFGQIFGVGSFAFGLGVALGPYSLSLVQSASGSAIAPLLVAAAVLLVAVGAFVATPRQVRGAREPDGIPVPSAATAAAE